MRIYIEPLEGRKLLAADPWGISVSKGCVVTKVGHTLYVEGTRHKDNINIAATSKVSTLGSKPIIRVETGDDDDKIFVEAGFVPITLIAYGGNGNDIIIARDGNDTLDGGAGNDELYGENGNDHLYGGLGSDKIFGGNGRDVLLSGALESGKYDHDPVGERDTLDGGSGIDTWQARTGDDLRTGLNIRSSYFILS